MIDNIIVKESEFQGKVIKQLYVVIDKKEFLLGTIKDKVSSSGDPIRYINCVHKEFKKF